MPKNSSNEAEFSANYGKQFDQYWEQCDETFAHLKVDKWLKDTESLFAGWEASFLKHYNLRDKILVDYGIGGAWLGVLLLREKGLRKYVGIDIADRSLENARNNLANLGDFELYKPDVDFSSLKADVFMSQACIQHFPSLGYYKSFLKRLNRSGIPELMLQIRHAPDLRFEPENPRLACQTNIRDLNKRLTEYHMTFATAPNQKSGYQYIGFKRTKKRPWHVRAAWWTLNHLPRPVAAVALRGVR